MSEQSGNQLKNLRTGLNLSLASVAESSGRSVSTLSNMESESGIPNADFLRKLAKTLETSPSTLVAWRDGPTPMEVYDFYRFLHQYQIRELSKTVRIEANGDADISLRVGGLRNLSRGNSLRIRHSIHFGPDFDAPQDAAEQAHSESERSSMFAESDSVFAWEGACKDAGLPVPKLKVDDPKSRMAYFEPAFPTSSDHYDYSLQYSCRRAFRMTEEEAVKSDPTMLEWSQFYIDKPIEHLTLEVFFPEGYRPGLPTWEVWKRHFLYSPHRELAPGLSRFPKNNRWTPFSASNRSFKLEVDYPVQGLSYGVVWRPTGE